MNQYFYAPPFKELLSDEQITPIEKLVYLSISSWFGYCEYKQQKCLFNPSITADELSLNIYDVHLAIDNLKNNGYIELSKKGNEILNINNKPPTTPW